MEHYEKINRIIEDVRNMIKKNLKYSYWMDDGSFSSAGLENKNLIKGEFKKVWEIFETAYSLINTIGDPTYYGYGNYNLSYELKIWENLTIKPRHFSTNIGSALYIAWWEYEDKTIILSLTGHDACTLLKINIELLG